LTALAGGVGCALRFEAAMLAGGLLQRLTTRAA
jgi:hypothetical protein